MARTHEWMLGLLLACGGRSELRTVSDHPKEAGPPPDITPDFVWYKLDEGTGEVAHDSANHHDVWLTGVAWDGDGAIFDGVSVCGSTSVPESFRAPPVTMSAWLTPEARDDATSNAYALTPFPPSAVSGDYPASGGYGLGLDVWTDGSGGHALSVETGTGAPLAFHSIDGGFDAGERRFIALVIGTADATIYVDGKMLQQMTDDITPNVTPAPLHLGCHNDDGGYGTKRFFKGHMRDVRIWKRALGTGEIAQLFTNGPV